MKSLLGIILEQANLNLAALILHALLLGLCVRLAIVNYGEEKKRKSSVTLDRCG